MYVQNIFAVYSQTEVQYRLIVELPGEIHVGRLTFPKKNLF